MANKLLIPHHGICLQFFHTSTSTCSHYSMSPIGGVGGIYSMLQSVCLSVLALSSSVTRPISFIIYNSCIFHRDHGTWGLIHIQQNLVPCQGNYSHFYPKLCKMITCTVHTVCTKSEIMNVGTFGHWSLLHVPL